MVHNRQSGELHATSDRLQHYIKRDMRTVSGWLANESAQMISTLALEQIESGLQGGVGEIGIHHGKLFLLLYLTLQDGERSFALDVFEKQEFNVDSSGLGDREIFESNFRKIGGELSRVSIFSCDSCSVTSKDLISAAGPLRLMSIDGGHTEEVTYNDLGLAEDILVDNGILILDDLQTERWPAVAAGTYRFLLEKNPSLKPFAMSPNKTYFSKNEYGRDKYRKIMVQNFGQLQRGTARIYGSEIAIFGRRTITNRVRNLPALKRNPKLYRKLSSLRHRLK